MKKRLLVIVFSLLSFTACGDYDRGIIQLTPRVLVQHPPVINQPIPNYPIPNNNYVVVQRGFYSGCRGYVQNIFISYPYGRIYVINPLVCGARVFYNVQIAETFIQ